ncbi:hypothetical protein LXL04_021779 [Taraxacum kok-saghyz]
MAATKLKGIDRCQALAVFKNGESIEEEEGRHHAPQTTEGSALSLCPLYSSLLQSKTQANAPPLTAVRLRRPSPRIRQTNRHFLNLCSYLHQLFPLSSNDHLLLKVPSSWDGIPFLVSLSELRSMEMERGIDPDTLLDYVELQIFPIQNRYEAYVCINSKAQKVASGTLERLLLHSPRVKDLSSKGSNTNFKILPPDNPNDADWFTTTTLTRFLYIIGSQDIVSIGNEIIQLEETRKFQLSLSVKAEVDITSSINSKNELLRAVDLRLTALKDELASAFDQVTGQRCSTKDISDLENFSHHFGAKDIRDSLQKFVEMNLFPSPQASNTTTITTTTTFNKNDKNTPTPDNEHSSVSSDDINNNQPSIERSRTVTRSITPRRSASPMRRIQIGRCGSHRAAALTIKSLNYFPPREKLGFQKDHSNSSEEEEEEEEEEGPTKKNVLRLSVQDKISLFESKQKGETVNFVKSKTLLNTKKGVLRRWSSGMGETTTTTTTNNNDNTETALENVVPEIETVEKITKVDGFDPEREEKKVDSIEWSQQKEVELNQLFTEMMESKPVKPKKLTDDDVSKSEKVEQRSGFYDDYKQKRDVKLIKKETTGKRAEKEAQFKVMKRFIDENKPQKSQRNSIPLTNSRKESPKPTLKKPNALPTTRKSWPATQPPKAKEASPSRTIRKPQSTSSSTKAEKSKSKSKSTPPPPVVAASKNLEKPIKEKKQPTVTKVTKDLKTIKSTKPKVKVNTPESDSKPSFINKVTKKNSVVPVPLESKPFLRKGSGIKTKVPEASRSFETLVQSEENEVVMVTTDVTESLDLEPHVVKFEELETVAPERVEMSEQESVIPPSAWVESESESEPEPESEEVEEMIPIPVPTLSPVKVVKPDVGIGVGNGIGITSPRIRHSLSQMLLEDNNEDGDNNNNGEWGNAENPPSILYQKEPPKGLKRLLNTTKGRRSFFSLSTFRGSKTNESKIP